MSVSVDDVRHEDYITAAGKERQIDSGCTRCRLSVLVKSLGILVIEVDHHSILLIRIEIFSGDEETVERSAVICFPMNELYLTPIVISLLRID